jgi:hypothetical protein
MGVPRLLAAVLGLASAACQLAPPRVHNLHELHQPDGRPKREARLLGDIGYLLERGLRASNYAGEGLPVASSATKRIEDPLGKCLTNVCALARCARDEKVAGLQAATFAWLAVECTHPLSRERCLLALGELAPLLPSVPPPVGEPASAEEVKVAFDDLVANAREAVAAPELAGNALRESAERVRALALDRAGAVRLLRAVNAMLEHGERGAVRAPLRALRLELARRATELAVRAGLEDGNGRVRAAALEAALRTFPAERFERLRWGLGDPMEGLEDRGAVALRALELLAAHGPPPAPEGGDARVQTEELRGLAAGILARQAGGPLSVAACRALAKIDGRPASLRPEVWLARHEDEAAEESVGAP